MLEGFRMWALCASGLQVLQSICNDFALYSVRVWKDLFSVI